jgi:hypothetical protein
MFTHERKAGWGICDDKTIVSGPQFSQCPPQISIFLSPIGSQIGRDFGNLPVGIANKQ